MTLDMSKYLGLFVTESTEHLEALGRELVRLDQGYNPAAVDAMFRHAHSVKGMASSMGFERIATLAHRVEDVVDVFRSQPDRLEQAVVDLLLQASDLLLSQVRAVGANQVEPPATEILAALTTRLTGWGAPVALTRVANVSVRETAPSPAAPAVSEAPDGAAVSGPRDRRRSSTPPGNHDGAGEVPLARGPEDDSTPPHGRPVLQAPPVPPAKAPVVVAPAASGPRPEGAALGLPPRFALKVRVVPTCQVPGVRAFLMHKRLTALGNVFDLRPPYEDLKAGRIPDGNISLELETSGGEAAVRQALKNIPEIELVSLLPVVHTQAPPAAPTLPAVPTPEGPRPVGQEPARTVRVRTELLDYFLDTVGELLLATARIREVGKTLGTAPRAQLEESVDRLHGLVKDLHDKVMTVRMTPVSVIVDRLPRVARDIARRRGRDVELVITGAEIELDRAILDDLADPLMHVLRNCIDHGIESPEERVQAGKPGRGKVTVGIRRQRDRVVLEMEDDGRGMDAAKLKAAALARGLLTAEAAERMTDKEAFLLCCMPGVSTARDVTEISGRGVGMDAVKRVVEQVGGTLEIDSERGRGTRFTLRLPLTVAVVNLLLVSVGDEIFGLPIAKVLGAVEAEPSRITQSRESAMLPLDGTLIPVHELASLLQIPGLRHVGAQPYVVMEGETGKLALAVDTLRGQEEVVLKALSRPLDMVPGLSGVTILGSGRPIFILDVPRLIAA